MLHCSDFFLLFFSMDALRRQVYAILHAHGGTALVREFLAHPTNSVPSKPPRTADQSTKQQEEPDVWSVEISPKEGICSFSKPLIIATETIDLDQLEEPSTTNPENARRNDDDKRPQRRRRLVRIAHFWADVWDVMYDPILEFHDDGESWTPVSIFQHHTGYKELAGSASGVEGVLKHQQQVEEIRTMCSEWADTLKNRGYHLTEQCVCQRIGKRVLDSVSAHL